MAIGVKIELLGDKKLDAALARLSGPAQKKAFRKSAREAFKPVLAAAKQKVPVDTGKLKKSLKLRSLKRSRGTIGVEVRTGTREELEIPADEPGYYPMAVEAGTKTQPAQPYIRPAFDENKDLVERRLRAALARNIDEAWNRP